MSNRTECTLPLISGIPLERFCPRAVIRMAAWGGKKEQLILVIAFSAFLGLSPIRKESQLGTSCLSLLNLFCFLEKNRGKRPGD